MRAHDLHTHTAALYSHPLFSGREGNLQVLYAIVSLAQSGTWKHLCEEEVDETCFQQSSSAHDILSFKLWLKTRLSQEVSPAATFSGTHSPAQHTCIHWLLSCF